MRLIGLDLRTKCGWAMTPDHKHTEYVIAGTWDLSPKRFEGGGMRYLRFRRLLLELLRCDGQSVEAGSCAVYFEEVRRHAGTDAAHVYGGLMGVLSELCEVRLIPYAGVPVGTIKKLATGKGNASKEMMIRAAGEQWPRLPIEDDNQADAMWVLACGHDELKGVRTECQQSELSEPKPPHRPSPV